MSSKLCAYCVENEAVLMWKHFHLCGPCRAYAIEHGELNKKAVPVPKTLGSSGYGGGGYKPNMDEVNEWPGGKAR